MMRSDLDRNWEEIDTAVRQVKEGTTCNTSNDESGSEQHIVKDYKSKGIIYCSGNESATLYI